MSSILSQIINKLTYNKPVVATVAINMRPARGPWGGSSVFVEQCAALLRRRGYRVTYSLKDSPDLVVIIDPREDLQNKAFGMLELAKYRECRPEVRVLHRINECDQRKGTRFMDDLLQKANSMADYTVFISSWLRDYFAERWFNPGNSHSVIYNGADPAIFYPVGTKVWQKGQPLRLVTHHWSDNPMKGFALYQQLDKSIADGKLSGTEFWVIGRWPREMTWQAAKTFPPTQGKSLADLLRQCHGYITASLWEPCGMHHVEGAQCGLPLLYHRDGGGINEAGALYGIEFTEDTLIERIVDFRNDYASLREKVLKQIPSGDKMAIEYANVIQEMLCK